MHKFFKSSLKKWESDTLIVGERKSIRVFFASGMSKNKKQKNNINRWGGCNNNGPKLPDYISAAMKKTNIESMQAIHYISKRTKK